MASDNIRTKESSTALPTPFAVERVGPADRVSIVLMILAAAGVLVLCALLGIVREGRQQSPPRGRSSARPLAYGRPVPTFRLVTTSGRHVDSGDLHGSWTLLVFSATWCPPCTEELQALARAHTRLNRYVRILPVVEGRSVLISPRAAAGGYARRLQLPFEMAIDPDKSVGAAFGASDALPHSVLVDPSGAVRFISTDHELMAKGSSRLADGLASFFTGSAPESMPLLQWRRFRPAPDARVYLQGGTQTRLSDLSRTGTLVLTFLTGGDPMEIVRIRALGRFAKAPGVRFLFVVNEPAAKPMGLGQDDGMLVAEHDTGPLFAAYRVHRGPVSAILHRGRLVLREDVAQPSGDPFETELAYAVLLSSLGEPTQKAGRAT